MTITYLAGNKITGTSSDTKPTLVSILSTFFETDTDKNYTFDTGSWVEYGGGESVPSGTITMWSGLLANIPTGWVLCDGNNGTPNLIAKFVRSINTSATEAGSTGGADSVTLSTNQMPSHNHSFSGSSHSHGLSGTTNARSEHINGSGTWGDSRSSPSGSWWYTGTLSGSTTGASAGGTVGSSGSGTSHENRPAYYELAYIMKT